MTGYPFQLKQNVAVQSDEAVIISNLGGWAELPTSLHKKEVVVTYIDGV
jgi:hypothetical protein